MDFESKIKKAEEIANLSSDKYQEVTYQEVLRYFLLSDVGPTDRSAVSINPSNSISQNGTPEDEIPEAYLVVQHGDLKHQIAWAVMKLNEKGEEGKVQNVRNVIDLELSLKKPSRPYTSNILAQLVPKYLSRKKPDSGKGYIYLPNSNTINIFNDLLSSEQDD